jgi:hypothetical protein
LLHDHRRRRSWGGRVQPGDPLTHHAAVRATGGGPTLSQDGSRGVPRVGSLGAHLWCAAACPPSTTGRRAGRTQRTWRPSWGWGEWACSSSPGSLRRNCNPDCNHRPRTVRPTSTGSGHFPARKGKRHYGEYRAATGRLRFSVRKPGFESRLRCLVKAWRMRGFFISGLRPGPKLCPEFVPKSAFGGNRRFAWKRVSG